MTVKGQPRIRRGPTYREVFFAYNGPGPYECCFCHEDVTMELVYVHHDDHNKKNNDPSNLKAAHGGCHSGHHSKDRNFKHSEEWKAELSRRQKGVKKSPEQIAAMAAGRRAGAAKRGKTW